MSLTKEAKEQRKQKEESNNVELFRNKVERWIKEKRDSSYRVYELSGWVVPYLVAKHKRNFSWDKNRERVAIPEYSGRGCFDLIVINEPLPSIIKYPAERWYRGRNYSSIFKDFSFLLFARTSSGDFLLPTSFQPTLGGSGLDVYVEIGDDRWKPLEF